MSDPGALVDAIFQTDAGEIASINLLMSRLLGQFDDATVRAILMWWGEYTIWRDGDKEHIASYLGLLTSWRASGSPYGFATPTIPLPDLYLADRRAGGISAGGRAATIQTGPTVVRWADTTVLRDECIDLTARPDQIAYRDLLAAAERTWILSTDRGKMITYHPVSLDLGILFYTPEAVLWNQLNAIPLSERADRARDLLGLVHRGRGENLILVSIASELVENRVDRGRPTAVDAGGNQRFVCTTSHTGEVRAWGYTADLSTFDANTIGLGLQERVCGKFPPAGYHTVPVQIRPIGTVTLSRHDGVGERDDEFLSALRRQYADLDSNSDPREVVLSLLEREP